MTPASDPVDEFWQAFAAATGVRAGYEAWSFGDESRPALADELAHLVLDGPKRATTGLLAEYEQDGDPLPKVGDYDVILDGGGAPVCIIRSTHVEVRRFGDVDDEFAWVEGEGDRSLAYWRRAHLAYYAGAGWEVDDDTEVVLVTFDKVWPV